MMDTENLTYKITNLPSYIGKNNWY